jgi:hypothetical protein
MGAAARWAPRPDGRRGSMGAGTMDGRPMDGRPDGRRGPMGAGTMDGRPMVRRPH